MAETGHKTALGEAIVEDRSQRATSESDLFELATPEQARPARIGRPPGARNRRTDELSRWYIAKHGDPLERAVAVASLPILADGVLQELAHKLGMDKKGAAQFWLGVLNATLPFVHQRLSTLVVKPEGAPDGEPVEFRFSDDGAFLDISPIGELETVENG